MSLRKSPIRTPKLLATNRANARKSTGPRTAGGKAHARLNRLRHGRRSPLFARFWTALQENPSKCRWVTQRLLKLEDTRHPLFARYLRQWGKLWTRGHAYQLAIKRDLKRVERLVRQLRATEVETGGEWQGRPDRIWQRQGARRRELLSILSQNRRKMHKRGTPPPRNNDRSRNVADKKGDTKRAVVQDVGKQRCRVLSIT